MKLKQLFFGGLLLAVPFTACTNEDVLENIPVSAEDLVSNAESLGEDFSIVVSKGMGEKSRIVIPGDFSAPAWELTDSIGAGWFAVLNEDEEAADFLTYQGTKSFFSNHPFAFHKDLSNGKMTTVEFKAPTNAFKGKYVLYYPYNFKNTEIAANIPVELNLNPVMDCTAGNELNHVEKNTFAWTTADFTVGGSQTEDFQVNPINNIIALTIGATELNDDRIAGKVVKQIILEGDNDNLVNKAAIAPNDKTKYAEAAGEYAEGNGVKAYILGVENATDDYKVSAAGEDGVAKKPFYISMLPAKDDIETLTVKVIFTDNTVYKAELTKEDYPEEFDLLIGKDIKGTQGKLVELTAMLDEAVSATNGVYTAEQFYAELAQISASKQSITLATDITLPSLTASKFFAIDGTGCKLTVEGDMNVSTSVLTANVEMAVGGDLNVTDGGTFVASEGISEIGGDVVVADGSTFTATVGEIKGSLEVTGTANITGESDGKSKIASVDATKASAIELEDITVSGTMSAAKSANIALDGVTLSGAATLTNAFVTFVGDAATTFGGKVTSTGTSFGYAGATPAAIVKSTFNATDGSIHTDVAALKNWGGTMTLDGFTIEGTNGLENNGTVNIQGKDITISKFVNAEAEAAVSNVNPALAAGILNIAMGETSVGSGDYNTYTIGSKLESQAGATITLTTGTVVEQTANHFDIQEGSTMTVAKDGVLSLQASNGSDGTVIIENVDNLPVVFGSDAVVAAKITKASELNITTGKLTAALQGKVTDNIIAYQATLDGTTTEINSLLVAKNLNLQSSIKLGVALTMTKTLKVEGDVTISYSGSSAPAVGNPWVLTLNKDNGAKVIGTLTIGNGVKLAGPNEGANVNVADGSLKKSGTGLIDNDKIKLVLQ